MDRESTKKLRSKAGNLPKGMKRYVLELCKDNEALWERIDTQDDQISRLKGRIDDLKEEKDNLLEERKDLRSKNAGLQTYKRYHRGRTQAQNDLEWLEAELERILCYKPEGRMNEKSYVERVVAYIKRTEKERRDE